MKKVLAMAILGLVLSAPLAEARSNVSIGLGLNMGNVGLGFSTGRSYYRPYPYMRGPMYYPAPRYYAPAPIIVQAPPVVVAAPAPVVTVPVQYGYQPYAYPPTYYGPMY